MALGIGFGHQGQVLGRAAASQLEGKAVNSLDADAGEGRHLGGDLDRQALMHPTATAGVLTF
ncbi:hypothetical protein D3C76_1726850 [compost metagenome]